MITNTNGSVWKQLEAKIKLPEELIELEKLTYNLWWSWNYEATDLFYELDQELWVKYNNPVILLERLSQNRIHEIVGDKVLRKKIKTVIGKFEKYMSKAVDPAKPTIAYFSMEYGLTNILKIYSGGLGILAGDFLKEASDSNVDLVGIGLLYRYGYFTQGISPDGYQIAEYESQNFNELPINRVCQSDGKPLILAVPFHDRSVYVNVWRVDIGRIQLYLMDSDTDLNSEFDKSITSQLYGGDWENRIKQEYLLGIGGIFLLEKLGIKKDVYHCNEGHAAFINVQRLVNLIEYKGLTFNQALEIVRASSLYTVHTPVPAGHDYFEEGLLGKYMGQYPGKLGISWAEFMDMGREHPGLNEKFCMSIFALKTSQEANGVSLLHGKVSRSMFQPIWNEYYAEELHISHVTNGVHMPTWATRESKLLYEKHFDESFYDDQSNPNIWNKIQEVPDSQIWEMRTHLKERFLEYVGNTMKDTFVKSQVSPSLLLKVVDNFNPQALFVGFARRFATYKRAHLLFTDLNRLSRLLNNEKYPIHFIFAGKSHPADKAGQDLIKRIIEISRQPEFLGKIIFLENYDMQLAKRLISGVDIWLNTPTRPLEASGTSGEKALMNGVLNFSVLDGWWYEGYRENTGWALSDTITYADSAYQNELDAITMYYIFENKILPSYYARNDKGYSPEWIQYIKNSVSSIAPLYTTKRMMDDYLQKFYIPLFNKTKELAENEYEKARSIAQWKRNTLDNWNDISVESIHIFDQDGKEQIQSPLLTDGNTIVIEIMLDKKNMKGSLGIDFVLSKFDISKNEYIYHSSQEMSLMKEEAGKLFFRYEYTAKESGSFNYSYRIFPKSDLMSHRMDFPIVKWI